MMHNVLVAGLQHCCLYNSGTIIQSSEVIGEKTTTFKSLFTENIRLMF